MSARPSGDHRRITIAPEAPAGGRPYDHFQPILAELTSWGHPPGTQWQFIGQQSEWIIRVIGHVDVERAARTFELPSTFLTGRGTNGIWGIWDPVNFVSLVDEAVRPESLGIREWWRARRDRRQP